MSKTPRTKSEAIAYTVRLGHLACNRIDELETENAELEAQMEAMKCCGNCEFQYDTGLQFMVIRNEPCVSCNDYSQWQPKGGKGE
jgi:hypothetical protein